MIVINDSSLLLGLKDFLKRNKDFDIVLPSKVGDDLFKDNYHLIVVDSFSVKSMCSFIKDQKLNADYFIPAFFLSSEKETSIKWTNDCFDDVLAVSDDLELMINRVKNYLLIQENQIENGNIESHVSKHDSVSKSNNKSVSAIDLNSAIESAINAIAIVDKDGMIEWVNNAFTSLTGYSSEEAIGQNPRILKSGKHPDKFYKEIWETVLDGRVWHDEIVNKRKDGSLYNEELTITPIRNSHGQIVRFIVVKQNISKRKELEDLLQYQYTMQQVINNMLSQYISLDPIKYEEVISFILGELGSFIKASRMYYLEFDEIGNAGNNLFEWCEKGVSPSMSKLDGMQVQHVADWIKEKLSSNDGVCTLDIETVLNEEVKAIFANVMTKSLIYAPVIYKESQIGFIGIEFVKNRHTLSMQELNLLDTVAYIITNIKHRAVALKEMLVKKNNAEAAVRLKASFLSNLNHEIRTPLNAVMGFADLMSEALCEEKDLYSKIVLNSTRQLLKLIDDVIFLSKLQSDNLIIRLSVSSPSEIVLMVHQMFLASKQNKSNIDFKISIPDNLKNLAFMADVEKIQQVLINFVSNAFKYASFGYIEIGFLKKENFVEFYVKDTGRGISEDEKAKVFDAFFRSNDVIFSSISGTGLGLNISKGLVDALGGEIGVESVLNKGSRFYFTIPLKPIEENTRSVQKEKPSRQWNDLSVLVAEDDDDSYLLLHKLLSRKVNTLDHAVDGLEAISMALKNDYDLILMNIKMPELNGLEAAGHIKSKKPWAFIVAQTAYPLGEELNEKLISICDAYLVKPIMKETLFKLIEEKLL